MSILLQRLKIKRRKNILILQYYLSSFFQFDLNELVHMVHFVSHGDVTFSILKLFTMFLMEIVYSIEETKRFHYKLDFSRLF